MPRAVYSPPSIGASLRRRTVVEIERGMMRDSDAMREKGASMNVRQVAAAEVVADVYAERQFSLSGPFRIGPAVIRDESAAPFRRAKPADAPRWSPCDDMDPDDDDPFEDDDDDDDDDDDFFADDDDDDLDDDDEEDDDDFDLEEDWIDDVGTSLGSILR